MNFSRLTPFMLAAGAMLGGCGVDQVRPGQTVKLEPGQGIAAVVIDTLDPLDSISIESPGDKGKPSIVIAEVPKGANLYAYQLPMGKYCVVSFHYGTWRINQKDPVGGACFVVVPGKVVYSGNIGPRVYGKEIRIEQAFDWPAFRELLSRQYPDLSTLPLVQP